MSTPDKLTDLSGTAEYAIEVGWGEDQTQPGRAVTDLITRYEYLNQLLSNPPDAPEYGAGETPPTPPTVPIDLYYDEDAYDTAGKPGSPEQLKELLDALLVISNEGDATGTMVQQIDRLILSFRMVGIVNSVTPPIAQVPEDVPSNADLPVIIPAQPPKIVLNSLSAAQFDAALQRWRDLPGTDDVVRKTIHAGTGARIDNLPEDEQFNESSLQHLIRFEYVVRGNEIMYNALAGLHDSLALVEETMGILNQVGDILNQKEPEEATVDILALVGLNRNTPGYRVDLESGKGFPSRDPRSFAAQLDAWENRQFNRELGRVVLDTGDDSTGFIRRMNQRDGIENVYLPGLDDAGLTDGTNRDFAGTINNLPFVPGSVEIKAGEDGAEVFRDDGNGNLTSNFGGTGTIDYNTGDWSVEFLDPPRIPDRTVTVQYKYARPIAEGPLEATPAIGDGANQSFSGTVEITPPNPTTFFLTDGREQIRDDGNGNLVDSLGATVGSIDYNTGAWSANFPVAPVENAPIEFSYEHYFFPRTGFQIGMGDHLTTDFPIPIPNPPDPNAEYFSQRIHPYPIRPETVEVHAINTLGEEVLLEDDGSGNLSGADGSTGTIDYATGEISISFVDPPAFGTEISVDWLQNSIVPDTDLGTVSLDSTDGVSRGFEGQLEVFPIDPGSFDVNFTGGGSGTLVDHGNGTLSGTMTEGGTDYDVTGTVDYLTGEWSVTFLSSSAPPAGVDMEVEYALHDGIPDDNAMVLALMGAKVSALVERLPEGDLKERMIAVREDLLGNSFVPTQDVPEFNLGVYIRDFRDGAVNEYQRNLSRALVAAQSLNDSEKEELRRRFYEFEEFYKSASSIMSKISQILEKIAQNISR